MTFDMWVSLIILILAVILFITEWLRVDVVALGVVVALLLTGLLNTEEAFSGFSNSAVLTIAALFVVGGGVMQTGLAGAIGRRILAVAGSKPHSLMVVIMLTVALLSGFMSDTGTVAVLLPAIISLARSEKISPSKLLIPLSFGALLGGAATLIGTTPNLIVSDLLQEAGYTPFEFFEFSPIGITLIVVGIGFMVIYGHRMLPARLEIKELQRVETPEELAQLYRLPDNLFKLRVRRVSSISGKSLSETRLRPDFNLTVLEVRRTPPSKQIVKLGQNQLTLSSATLDSLTPSPDLILQDNDILIVQGNGTDTAHAAAVLNLGVQPAAPEEDTSHLITQEVGLAEVLLPPRSSLLGKTIVDLQFGTRYKLTVLGIHGPGENKFLDIANTPLRFGDMLLVQGSWENILALRKFRRDFVVMGQPETMVSAPMRTKAPYALIILFGMLVFMISGVISVPTASMLAALLMVLAGCLTIDDAYDFIDWKSIVLMAGMLPMSLALENTGVVNMAASGLSASLGQISPQMVLFSLFLVTSLFTQVLSNTATTFLIAPIALATAQAMGIQPEGFMMGVAIAASMAFASPVASPVNTLVMGAGGYRFSDYIKVGGPLIILLMLTAVFIIPVLFPF